MKSKSRKETIRKRKTVICLLCCLTVLLLAACGKSEKEETGAADPNQIYYHFQETVIPDPPGVVGNVSERKYSISGSALRLCGDTFYRFVQLSATEEPYQWKNYIQLLKPPYQEWVTEEIGSSEDSLISILGEKQDGLVFLMRDRDKKDNGLYTYYLAHWQQGSDGLDRVQESEFDSEETVFSDNGEFFATSAGGYCYYDFWKSGTVILFDEQFRLEEKKELGEGIRVCGVLQDPESESLLWYGMKDLEAGVWNLEDGTPVLKEGQSLGTVNAMNFHAAYGADGVLYLTDNQNLWRIAEGELTAVCRFFDRDYPLTELYGMETLEDSSLLLHTKCTGEELVLRIEGNHEPLPEKQEIKIASPNPLMYDLNVAIAKFNRTNEQYYVTMQYPYDPLSDTGGDIRAALEEFKNKLQMELSAGRGPDLYLCRISNGGVINPSAMAREGYLQSLEGVLEDEEDYWTAALEAGRIDGIQYGIPYSCHLNLVAYSRDFVGGRTAWTLQELMEAARESDAEILQWGYDGIDIVLYYGLYDNDNRDFIDWETGESHLDEEPFKDLLEFAREYADDIDITIPDYERLMKDVAEGRILAVYNFMETNWGTIWGDSLESLETIFQGEPVCIGYPRSKGNGIYASPEMFFMNANSDKREGVEELLRFLLSDEVQRRLNYETMVENYAIPPTLPVRLSALEEGIETAREKKERGVAGSLWNPILTEEQAEAARFLIENAQPARWKITEVEDILFEELQLYFQGQRSLKETVKILDNRVQLYLDER